MVIAPTPVQPTFIVNGPTLEPQTPALLQPGTCKPPLPPPNHPGFYIKHYKPLMWGDYSVSHTPAATNKCWARCSEMQGGWVTLSMHPNCWLPKVRPQCPLARTPARLLPETCGGITGPIFIHPSLSSSDCRGYYFRLWSNYPNG